MISLIHPNLSALQAIQSAVNVGAHNVANAQTAGFEPVQAVFQALESGGVRLEIHQPDHAAQNQNNDESPENQHRGTDLAREAVNQLVYQKSFKANLAFIKSADRTLGEIIDLLA